ncbi:MAG: polyprenyl synthetase family protein [Candidatus Rokuibacteriota bacterium]
MPTPTLERLLKERVGALVGEDLQAVEDEIRRELDSPVELIQAMGGYIANAGGKRLRPMLLLLAARLAGAHGPRSVRLACVVELLHTATLIHDDVVDQAPLRRGRPSANAQWGDDASVLVGDHLYSKSFAMLVRDNDRGVMETLARATVSMTEAEVFQLERKRSGVTTEADYIRIITQKTASFISACCRIGALLGAVPVPQVEALTRYGLHVGVAFQIADDSLDFVADQARLGKAIGADLKEGKRTLPLIAMLERASAAEADRVRSLLKRRALAAPEVEEIRRLVIRHDGVSYALERAGSYAAAAKTDLAGFPAGQERDTLALIADFVVDRDR